MCDKETEKNFYFLREKEIKIIRQICTRGMNVEHVVQYIQESKCCCHMMSLK